MDFIDSLRNSIYKYAWIDLILDEDVQSKFAFGKRGYYSAYLVIDNVDKLTDYHFYRQDKGGLWSHKRGDGIVTRLDASEKHLIRNPARANHFYAGPMYVGDDFIGNVNYINGGLLIWIKAR